MSSLENYWPKKKQLFLCVQLLYLKVQVVARIVDAAFP